MRSVLRLLVCWSAASLSANGQLPLYTFVGDETTFELGFAVDAAGDLDGDGYGDVILGSFSTGPVRVHSGRNGSVLLLVHPAPGDGSFGLAVAGTGDVDGDDVVDVAVSAPLGPGRVRIYSGATGQPLATFEADGEFDGLGRSLAALGDVQGDGHAELLVGTSFGNYARVYDGATLTPLFTLHGEPGDGLGSSVGAAGDFDGDGHLDAIVGAPGGNYARVVSGCDGRTIATFSGDGPDDLFGAAVGGGGDVDGDGRSDVLVGAGSGYLRVLSGATHEILHTIARPPGARGDPRGGTTLLGFGGSVDDAGDLDGDGFSDLLAGDATAGAHGAAYAFSGRDGGLLCTFLGIPLPEPTFGNAVASADDVDGDGRPDVLVGAPSAVNGRGYARVFACRPSPWTDLRTGHGDGPPRLEGSGALPARTLVSLDVFNVYGAGTLVVSDQFLGAPLLGGTLLPAPDFLIPLSGSLAGAARWELLVPLGVPAGISLFFQFWAPDRFEPSGWMSSNGVAALTP